MQRNLCYSLTYILFGYDWYEQIRVVFAARVNNVVPLIYSVFMTVAHNRFGRVIHILALDNQAQRFTRIEMRSGRPDLDLHRHDFMRFNLLFLPVSQYRLVFG